MRLETVDDILRARLENMDRETILSSIRELRREEKKLARSLRLFSELPGLTLGNLYRFAQKFGDMPEPESIPTESHDGREYPIREALLRKRGTTTMHLCGWCRYASGGFDLEEKGNVSPTCEILACAERPCLQKLTTICVIRTLSDDERFSLMDKAKDYVEAVRKDREQVAKKLEQLLEASRRFPRNPEKLAAARFNRLQIIREIENKAGVITVFTNTGRYEYPLSMIRLSTSSALPSGATYLLGSGPDGGFSITIMSGDTQKFSLYERLLSWGCEQSEDGLVCACGHLKSEHNSSGECIQCSCRNFDLYTDTWGVENPQLSMAIYLAETAAKALDALRQAEEELGKDCLIREGELLGLFQHPCGTLRRS